MRYSKEHEAKRKKQEVVLGSPVLYLEPGQSGV